MKEKSTDMIIYEDNALLVCHKPAGLAVQSANPAQADLESRLRAYLKGGELHIVHRLDQPVEGLLVFAKHKKAAAHLSAQASDGRMEKIYRAVVCGKMEPEKGELIHTLVKLKNGLGQVVPEEQKKRPEYKDAKQAKLSYRALRYNNDTDVSALEIHLQTGRFHQIRLQFSHVGHPLSGDRKYGGEAALAAALRIGFSGLALCACKLSFLHPDTEKQMHFEITPAFED